MNELGFVAILVGILHSGMRLATPYLYAAIGETFGQRSGVLNLGVEGMMLLGSFSAFYVVFQTGNAWLGLLAAAIVGAIMGLAMAFVSVTLQAEQGISGIGFYLFGLGASSLLFKTLVGSVEGVQGFSELHLGLEYSRGGPKPAGRRHSGRQRGPRALLHRHLWRHHGRHRRSVAVHLAAGYFSGRDD